MKSFFTILLLLICTISFSQSYRFTGNGNWSADSNWLNGNKPPAIISGYATIRISPLPDDSCVMDVTQSISKGASLTISRGHFIVNGNLNIIDSVPRPTTTYAPFNLTGCQATSGGDLVGYNGLHTIISRGLVWSTTPHPDITGRKTIELSSATGNFLHTMTDLLYDTIYYLRTYATNDVGTGYGPEISFRSRKLNNILTTNSITSITNTNAVSGGFFNADICLNNIYYLGVVWDTNPAPTLALPTQTFSSYTISSNTLSFTSDITDLQPNTTYYARAFIKFIDGRVFYAGNERGFTTAP